MVKQLKEYLCDNGYPLNVCWSEDATRITGGVEYKSLTDQLSGLVAPLDETNGLPITGLFDCVSPQKVIENIKKYPVGRNVQLAMVQPLAISAAPFCVLYYCTDNRFDKASVQSKWDHVTKEFVKHGISIACKATDGDSRFIGAMIEEMGLNNPGINQLNEFGNWFISLRGKVCVQDPTHLANKFRTRLMKRSKILILGKKAV